MHIAGIMILVVSILVLSVGGMSNHNFYTNNVYEVDQIGSILNNAVSTNNLSDKATYMTQVLDGLSDYSGNPKWLYPVDYTNFDSIKKVLSESIQTTLELDSRTDVDSMSYQQSLSVVDNTINVIKDRIHDSASAMNTNPEKNPTTWWVLFSFIMIAVITIWLVDGARPDGWFKYW